MKAFPTTTQSWDVYNGKDLSGMDLRDYFAAKAMQAMVNEYDDFNMMSKYAYQIADAMMEARESEDNSHEVIAEALTRLKEENNHNACGDPHCGICV